MRIGQEAAKKVFYKLMPQPLKPELLPLEQYLLPDLPTIVGNVDYQTLRAQLLRMHQLLVEGELDALVGVPVFHDILLKASNGKPLKDIKSKDEKIEAIGESFSVNEAITNDGRWNVIIVDDLFHTGASMEAACKVLRKYDKVQNIYVAALTWR